LPVIALKMLVPSADSSIMPLPLIPLAIGALIGSSTKKTKKLTAVSKHVKKNGTTVRAYTRKARSQ